ncbi:MAG: glycerol-3-phosphate acyltransferase [Candidatus Omnitrophica bacterium]|nr:glycerol-3-phosphate acyltransferase [Candidatus Omnitrophota bacterium]
MDKVGSFLVSYLLGSIPFSFLIAKITKGIDIRRVGTGNVGAANVFSSVSKTAGLTALILDFLKGWSAVFLASQVFGLDRFITLVSGFFAILGHNFPLFLRFRGGRGLATTIGIFSFMFFKPIIICGVVTAIIFFFLRKLILAILISTILFIILIIKEGAPNYIWNFVVFIVIFLVLRGYSTIEREIKHLIRGRKK